VVLSANAIDTPSRSNGNHKGSNDGVPNDDICHRTLMKVVIGVSLTFMESSYLRFFVSRDQRCQWIQAEKVAISADNPIRDVLVDRTDVCDGSATRFHCSRAHGVNTATRSWNM
jgi:hypothetical protein